MCGSTEISGVCVSVVLQRYLVCVCVLEWIGPNFSVRAWPAFDRVVPGPSPTTITIFSEPDGVNVSTVLFKLASVFYLAVFNLTFCLNRKNYLISD